MPRASPAGQPQSRARPRRGWVRKNLRIDQRKLDLARRELGVETETEAVDAALDAIAFRKELTSGIRRMRAVGGLGDIDEP